MAGATPKQQTSTPSRFTECSVCLGKMENPRSLPCIHFLEALEKVCDKCQERNKDLQCSQCVKWHVKYEVFGSKGSREGQFEDPTHLAISSVTQNLAVLDSCNNRVQIFDSRYKYLRTFGSKGHTPGKFDLEYSGGIAFTFQGQVVVADSWNHRVQVLTEKGDVITVVGSKGRGPGQFDRPQGLAVHQGHIYVADLDNHRIQILTSGGVFVREFATHDITGDWQPLNVAACDNGDVVVTVWRDDAGSKLILYTKDGNHKTSLCIGESGSVKLEEACGVTLDRQDNIIVTDYKTHKVHVVSQTGQLIHTFGSDGDKPGQFNCPMGVVCTKDGSIIVVDNDNHRIQLIKFE